MSIKSVTIWGKGLIFIPMVYQTAHILSLPHFQGHKNHCNFHFWNFKGVGIVYEGLYSKVQRDPLKKFCRHIHFYINLYRHFHEVVSKEIFLFLKLILLMRLIWLLLKLWKTDSVTVWTFKVDLLTITLLSWLK